MATSSEAAGKSAEDAFSKRLHEMTDTAFLVGVIGLSKELNLFDTMSTYTEPKSLADIAQGSGIKPRYLQEIVTVLVAGGVLEANNDLDKFSFPVAHRAALADTPTKYGCFASAIPRMFASYTEVLECCKISGPKGIPYETALPVDDWIGRSSPRRAPYVSQEIIASVPGLTAQLESGISVLELGCGFGSASAYMAKTFPASKFLATDFNVTPEKVEQNMDPSYLKLNNLTFESADVENLPSTMTGQFDWVYMMELLHDLPHPRKALQEIKRVLKPSGQFAFMDLSMSSDLKQQMRDPLSISMIAFSLFRCLPLGLNFENSEAGGVGMGREKMIAMTEEAGFKFVATREVKEMAFFTSYVFSLQS